MNITISSYHVVFAALSALLGSTESNNEISEQVLRGKLKDLSISELKLLSKRGVVSIIVNEEALTNEILWSQHINDKELSIDYLIKNNAPLGMLELIGINRNAYRNKKRLLNVTHVNGKPNLPSEKEINTIVSFWGKCKTKDNFSLVKKFQYIHQKTELSLVKIWLALKEEYL